MTSVIKKNRIRAAVKQGYRCYYCNFPMWRRKPDRFAEKYGMTKSEVARFRCTAEHLVPKQDGGGNDSNNIVAACLFCNATRHRFKNVQSSANYRQFVRRLVKRSEWKPSAIHELAGITQ